jgi:hypothetical protein
MIKSKKYNKHKDIFKLISKKTDTVCYNNNKKSFEFTFYDKNIEDNIVKYFINENMFEWEVKVYLYLVDKNIAPISSSGNQKMIYHTNDKLPLSVVLKNKNTKNTNIKFILNELFSFVSKFKKIHFVHGNLHLYNIFLDKDKMFSVIDFSNSKFKNKLPKYNLDYFYENHYLIDLYLLYIELYDFYKNNSEILCYLQDLLLNYIDNNNFKDITKAYIINYSLTH